MGQRIERREGESMGSYLGRFSIELAGAALAAREKGDQVYALFFAQKAAETLALAKALGYALPTPSKEGGE